jgi:2-haloacid dehalogenase
MSVTAAFDVYGTLIDTNGVIAKLQTMVGDSARTFAQRWREKQLEYSFRRGLMKQYQQFSMCTSQALNYTCAVFNNPLTATQKQELLDCYQALPAFADVQQGLNSLKSAGVRLFAFSNGSQQAIETLLVAASIRDSFLGVISVDDVKSFKPDPAVYQHFLTTAEVSTSEAWLVSSNPFDVIGAQSAGIRAIWVQRSKEAVFDPWEVEPTITIASLSELDSSLLGIVQENKVQESKI